MAHNGLAHAFGRVFSSRCTGVSFASFRGFLVLLMRFWGSIAFVSVFRGVPFNGQKTIRRQPAVLGS